uniref:TGF-beta family profile domain-containing protein n=1 Tax=Monopterus albus TaxID=43700 RepID=A0A3Q3JJ36_MONAL
MSCDRGQKTSRLQSGNNFLETSGTPERCGWGGPQRPFLHLRTLLLLLSLYLWSQQAEAVVQSSFKRLSSREKKEMQKEFLSILGLFGGADRLVQVSYAALPTLSTHTPPLGTVVTEADTVMSFVNLVEQERDLLQPRPYWKEFRFDLTPLPQGEAVTAAEFRIYKTLTMGQRANRTLHISVYEIQRENRHREAELVLLDMQSVPAGQEGWLAFDVTSASNHWLLHPRSNLGIRLYVETEEDRSLSAGWIGLVGRRGPRSKQPFMVTFFRESQVPCRPPRAVKPHPRKKKPKYDLPVPNRSPTNNVGEPCKKHELYVSFSDLGWKDWVLAPTGYSAYYCDGECFYPLGSCMNATNHAVIQQVVHLLKPDEVPKACCAPTKLSPISVLFYDDNNNVILKRHRNMVVKTCGCL